MVSFETTLSQYAGYRSSLFNAGFGGTLGILLHHDLISLHLMFRQSPLVPVFSTHIRMDFFYISQMMNVGLNAIA